MEYFKASSKFVGWNPNFDLALDTSMAPLNTVGYMNKLLWTEHQQSGSGTLAALSYLSQGGVYPV